MLEDLAAKDESQRNPTNEKNHIGVCKEALIALQSRRHFKTIELINKAIEGDEGDPVLHRCKATICTEAAKYESEDWNQTLLRKRGIDSARKACELSPNSVEFAHFNVKLLALKDKWEPGDYEEGMKECERALKIENPIDPAEECFQQEQLDAMINTTAQGRIDSLKEEIRLFEQSLPMFYDFLVEIEEGRMMAGYDCGF